MTGQDGQQQEVDAIMPLPCSECQQPRSTDPDSEEGMSGMCLRCLNGDLTAAGRAQSWAPPDGLAGSDEAVEAVKQRLLSRHWHPSEYERDSALAERWASLCASAVIETAEPIIAARVRAGAVAEALLLMRAHADDESLNPEALWRQVDRQWGQRYRSDMTAKDRERDEAVARAVAEERQRLANAILPDHWQTTETWGGVRRLVCGRCRHGDGVRFLWPCRTRRAITGEPEPEPDSTLVAAGSVPVATPTPTAPDDERPHSRACGWRRHEHGSACAVDCPTCAAGGGCPGPVAAPAEPELPVDWYHRHGTDEDTGRRFVYCEARGPVRAHCVRPRHGESEGTHQWAWFTGEDRTEAESAAEPSEDTGTPGLCLHHRSGPHDDCTGPATCSHGREIPHRFYDHMQGERVRCDGPQIAQSRTMGTGTPAAVPTFEQLLRDPLEQFDRRSELLPAILRHLCTPDVDALLRSIEEYRNAPPAAATIANIHPPRRKLMSLNVEGRHPGTQHFSPLFSFEHLPEGKPRTVSREFRTMAQQMIDGLPDGPELTVGLRKLLEAKDCFVRAAVLAAIKQ